MGLDPFERLRENPVPRRGNNTGSRNLSNGSNPISVQQPVPEQPHFHIASRSIACDSSCLHACTFCGCSPRARARWARTCCRAARRGLASLKFGITMTELVGRNSPNCGEGGREGGGKSADVRVRVSYANCGHVFPRG